jgi:hypothetical protein
MTPDNSGSRLAIATAARSSICHQPVGLPYRHHQTRVARFRRSELRRGRLGSVHARRCPPDNRWPSHSGRGRRRRIWDQRGRAGSSSHIGERYTRPVGQAVRRSSDPDGCGTILMMGCPIGIDWTVRHVDRLVRITDVVRYDSTNETEAVRYPELEVELPLDEYRRDKERSRDERRSCSRGSRSRFLTIWIERTTRACGRSTIGFSKRPARCALDLLRVVGLACSGSGSDHSSRCAVTPRVRCSYVMRAPTARRRR